MGDQESHLDLKDFRKALATLPSEQREVLTLVGASGLSTTIEWPPNPPANRTRMPYS